MAVVSTTNSEAALSAPISSTETAETTLRTAGAEGRETAANLSPVPEEEEREQRSFAHPPFENDEANENDAEDDEARDDGFVVPRLGVSTPLERK